jgi:hypothetical protein
VALHDVKRPQRVRFDKTYFRRFSRLEEDGRDIIIVPKADLPTERLVQWVKNQVIKAAEREILQEALLVKTAGFVEYDSDEGGRTVAHAIAEQFENEQDEPKLENVEFDNQLTLASVFIPHYERLTVPQQLFLREWVALEPEDRTLKEAGRRIGISYDAAKARWKRLWKTLEGLEGCPLKRPDLREPRRRKPLAD